MIWEHAWLRITPGRQEEFLTAMAQALPVIESAPGCFGATLQAQVEDPTVFLLLVQWSSVDAHVTDFRSSELFTQWRELFHSFLTTTPTVTHFFPPAARN